MKIWFMVMLVLTSFSIAFAQDEFIIFASRYGDEMPEEFATEIHKYKQLGEKRWHCAVYDVQTKYLLHEYECTSLLPDTIDGTYRQYWKGDTLIGEGNYINNRPNGIFKSYYLNGQIEEEGVYELGSKEGVWKYYYPNGKLMGRVTYRNNERLQWQYFDEAGKIVKRNFYDTAPEYPGGHVALGRYLSSVPYPADMRERHLSGVVTIVFIIDSSGKAHSPIVRYSTDTAFSIAVLKKFEEMPRWRPAYRHTQAVSIVTDISFTFIADEKEENIAFSLDLQKHGAEAFKDGDYNLAYQYFTEAAHLDALSNQAILYSAIAAINIYKIDEACKCVEYLVMHQGVKEARKYIKYCDWPRYAGMPLPLNTYILR